MHDISQFRIGNYRPIYLWAGPGTIRMNKLKFMGVNVDEQVHFSAHQTDSVNIVVDSLYQNWIHLTYSWGFPPEIELEDWESFELATQEYHRRNTKVFAYIQSSNCVYSGSFQNKNWYAMTPNGKKVFYYSGRFMTCFQQQEWLNYLKERISDAINRGADGIFFDNLWYGLQPNSLFNTWLGGAGCYCKTCQATYYSETGSKLPTFIDLKETDSIKYIEWRSQKMTQIIEELSIFSRSLKPDVVISANDYDPIMRPVKLIFGIDFEPLAKIQDVTMIENFALPKWQTEPVKILVNNALTIRNTQPFLPENKHLSVLSYDAGIGFDPVYPIRRTLTGMAEAAALGCSMTTKGTEYHDGQKMNLLTAPEYKKQQESIGNFHRWLEANQRVYENQTTRISEIAILHPGDLLWQNWHRMAPLFFATQQALLANGIPWRVTRDIEDLSDLNQVIHFDNHSLPKNLSTPPKFINAFELKSWEEFSESYFNRKPWLMSSLSEIADRLIRGYHGVKSMRKLMDWLGMSKLVTHTPFFRVPEVNFQNELLSLLSINRFRVISSNPVLLDIWKTKTSGINFHLVNYHTQKQRIKLKIPYNLSIKMTGYDQESEIIKENSGEITFNLDLYCIVSTITKEEKL